MGVAIILTLALLALQPGPKSNYELDAATKARLEQRAAYLNQEMARLLHEVERSRSAEETTLLSAWKRWQIWGIVGTVVLFSAACCQYWDRILPSDYGHEQESSSTREDNSKEEDDHHASLSGARSISRCTPSAKQGLPNECQELKELVESLLSVCRVLSRRHFMPQLYPATGMGDSCEAWNIQEKSIYYRLLMFLQPPPGHSFRLELDTTQELPGRPSNIHVVLECVCWKRQWLGSSMCFLHHQEHNLPGDRHSFMLQNLCTGSCLDMEKVACWVQLLVTSAWQFLPESQDCQLTVLPSTLSCKFQLASLAERNICMEMVFAVEQEMENQQCKFPIGNLC